MIGQQHIGTSIREEVIKRGAEFEEQYRAIKWTVAQLDEQGYVNLMARDAPATLSLAYQERLIAVLPPHIVRGMFHQIIEID